MKITEEYLEGEGYKKTIPYPGSLPEWVSEDGRVIISSYSNTVGRDWHVHLDTEDFQSIGSLDIQETETLTEFLRLAGYEENCGLEDPKSL